MNIKIKLKKTLKMKSILKIFFLFLFLCNYSYSQVRLGSSRSEILNEFPERNFSNGKTDSGYDYIYFQNESVIMHYYFNDDGICDMTVLGMFKQGTLNALVEQYNDQAVIIDNYNWKLYTKNGALVYITLKEISGIMTFIYSYRPVE